MLHFDFGQLRMPGNRSCVCIIRLILKARGEAESF